MSLAQSIASFADEQIDPRSLLLIVVGAHPRAERFDRPLAHRLAHAIECRLGDQRHRADPSAEDDFIDLAPLVCTDLWYLNDSPLQRQPVVCIGEPSINAATAYLANHLPTAFVIENTLRIHLDPEFIEAQACIWGVNSAATSSGIDLFIERYLDGFLRQSANT